MTTSGSKKYNNRRCSKCSSDMIKHPSMLSMPLTSPEPQSKTNNGTKKNIMNIKDQDANFIFRFHSCSKCGYAEFYLTNKSPGDRI
jgi:predicted nucleic-acid-binding Zn-ribbon protein